MVSSDGNPSEKYKLPGIFSDPAIQNIADLAAELCDVPIAAVQLVDDDFVWVLAKHGLLPPKIDRRSAFCDVPVREKQALIVDDLADDPRFASNPAVLGEPGYGFYAGFPLMTGAGQVIGTLCVLDYKSRTLDDRMKTRLERFSQIVVQLLDAHLIAKAQQETEKALEKERSFLSAVLENLSDGVVVCDAEGKLTLFNRALKEFHGLDSDASLDPTEWSHHYKLYRADGKTMMESAEVPLMRAFAGEHIRGVEMVIAASNRPPRHFLASGRSLFDKDGRKLGAVCAMHDVTDLKQKEADLLATNRALQSAMETKSQFFATMSHEIRTPLNGIVGMTEILKDSPLTAQQVENLEVIQMSAETLMTIVNDILDISKIEAGMVNLEQCEFDFETIVASICRSFQLAAKQKSLSLRYSVSGQSTKLRGDSNRIRQVITNFVANAVKFTARGEVCVSAKLSSGPDGKVQVHLAVKDTGIGISEEVIGRLFRPFSQADSSTTRKFGGTGLGLSICKNLIELMGGEIGVESSFGNGSEFWFKLILETANGANTSVLPSSTIPPQKASTSSIRVLLVEDNSMNRSIALQMLARLGYAVDVAMNGFEALERATGVTYDVILMDCQMPGMDGYEATSKIRSLSTRSKNSPIIALTANALQSDRDQCLAVGMTSYLSKPYRFADLKTAIEQVVPSKRAIGF